MMRLSLLHIPFLGGKKLSYLKFIFHIPVVLKAAFIGVFGKHPEIRINKTNNSEQIKNSDAE